MWQLTVVTIVGVLALGLLISTATRALAADERGRRTSPSLRAALSLLALVVVLVEGAALLATLRLEDSRTAAARNDVVGARAAARDARRLEPWAADPYLQLGLLDETSGDLKGAEQWLDGAVSRDHGNWRLRVVQVRLRVKSETSPVRGRRLPRLGASIPAPHC